MPLILAIEPDHRRAAQLADLIRKRLNADLVHADTTEGALTALAGIGDRVPDLVLVPSLLSAQEDTAIAGALRMIADAANVRMLTIPMLADPEQPPQHRGVFAKLRGRKTPKIPGGCDPAVFAEQIASYLAEAAAERRAQEADADLIESPTVHKARPVAIGPSDDIVPGSAGAVAAPIEPVREAVIEPTAEAATAPLPREMFAPLVIAPAPPLTSVEADTALIRDQPVQVERPLVLSEAPATPSPVEAPPSIWLTVPAEPSVEPEGEIAPLEAPADVVSVRDEPENSGPFASEPLERPAPVLVTEAAQVLTQEDATPDFALEEVLQALALEDTPQAIATEDQAQSTTFSEAPQILAREEMPQVVAIEFPQDVFLDDTTHAALEDAAPIASGLFDLPVSAPEPPPAGARRRPSNARPIVPESAETFDIDALLAPLLSEIAAKRVVPAPAEPVQVAPAGEVPPAVASSASEPISPPLVTAIERSEPITVPLVPEVAPALAEAVLTVGPTLEEPTLAVAPAFDETALAVAAALGEPTLEAAPVLGQTASVAAAALTEPAPAVAPELDETALAVAAALGEPTLEAAPALDETALMAPAALAKPTLAVAPALDETALAAAAALGEPTPAAAPALDEAALAVGPTLVEPPPVNEPPQAEPTLAVGPTFAEPQLAVEPLIAEPTLAAQPSPADWPSPVPTLAEHTSVHTPVEPAPIAAVAAAESDIDPMFFADNVHDGTADPAPHDRPAWVELIESLRKDIERLKAERTQPVEAAPPSTVTTQVAKPQLPRVGRVLSIAAARPASQAAATPAERVRNANPRKPHKPIQDQWGLFDPEQCGFAALRAKLDEISAREEVSV